MHTLFVYGVCMNCIYIWLSCAQYARTRTKHIPVPSVFLTYQPKHPPTQTLSPHNTTVGDRDLVNISAIRFESAASAGASTCDAAGAVYNDKEGVCVPLPPYAVRAGPRRTIYYDPAQVLCCREHVSVHVQHTLHHV